MVGQRVNAFNEICDPYRISYIPNVETIETAYILVTSKIYTPLLQNPYTVLSEYKNEV